jgi:hypothetical protein
MLEGIHRFFVWGGIAIMALAGGFAMRSNAVHTSAHAAYYDVYLTVRVDEDPVYYMGGVVATVEIIDQGPSSRSWSETFVKIIGQGYPAIFVNGPGMSENRLLDFNTSDYVGMRLPMVLEDEICLAAGPTCQKVTIDSLDTTSPWPAFTDRTGSTSPSRMSVAARLKLEAQ